jgi:hypothetical protein
MRDASGRRAAASLSALVLAAAVVSAPPGASATAPRFERAVHLARFFKGNTHAHTGRSYDAVGDPAAVARWFKSNGYAFLCVTDHDQNGPPGDLADVEDGSFIVIEGEEYTCLGVTHGRLTHPHVNGLGTTTTGPCAALGTTWQVVQDAVDKILAQGGIAQINHPNHKYSLTFADVMKVSGATLFEVANENPIVRNAGDARHESTEAMWDQLLTAGKRLWGVASDDSHALPDGPRTRPDPALPGRGWVQVQAASLTDADVLAALAAGDFYFTTGPEFTSIDVADSSISVALAASSVDGAPPDPPTIDFVGSGGRVLATSRGFSAAYALSGGEGYVRVRVRDMHRGDHDSAWTQPYFVAP